MNFIYLSRCMVIVDFSEMCFYVFSVPTKLGTLAVLELRGGRVYTTHTVLQCRIETRVSRS